MRIPLLLPFLLLLTAVSAAPGTLRSGPQPGERPLPFTSNMVTGPHRGQQHCYVCEFKDEPVVLIFARRMSPATGRLMRRLQQAAREHQKERLFGWVVFLGERGTSAETQLEAAAYAFAKANEATSLVVSALGDPEGPPGYLIAPEAEVTALLFRDRRIVANRAFRSKEWDEHAVGDVLKEIPRLLGTQPPPPAGAGVAYRAGTMR
jgi:hypothetical protein